MAALRTNRGLEVLLHLAQAAHDQGAWQTLRCEVEALRVGGHAFIIVRPLVLPRYLSAAMRLWFSGLMVWGPNMNNLIPALRGRCG